MLAESNNKSIIDAKINNSRAFPGGKLKSFLNMLPSTAPCQTQSFI